MPVTLSRISVLAPSMGPVYTHSPSCDPSDSVLVLRKSYPSLPGTGLRCTLNSTTEIKNEICESLSEWPSAGRVAARANHYRLNHRNGCGSDCAARAGRDGHSHEQRDGRPARNAE